ncbi:uncharacterized protein [Aegilops tauschii subsp. strangulata]|uniref:uncharacterized protein isoform X2 n=1 Tax=Aegilops tauschii subsp. strangulata TaxID=200361 RepID=UPI003CC89D36
MFFCLLVITSNGCVRDAFIHKKAGSVSEEHLKQMENAITDTPSFYFSTGTQVAIPVSSTDSLAALEVFDSMQFSVQGPPLPCCDVAASLGLLQARVMSR